MPKDFMVKESMLDDYQMDLLDRTLDRSLVVSGCAGSGKSVIALQKAKRIHAEKGTDYTVIVFTKALCDYMNGGRHELGLNNSFFYHWDWKNRRGMPKADYVIVDEAQDFTREEIQEFINSARKNIFFFGDTAQSIYGGLKSTLSMREIANMLPSADSVPLYFNYRLPKPIAKVTQTYIGVGVDPYRERTYKSTENQKPRFIHYSSGEDQIRAIARIIKARNLTDVGILVPHNEAIPKMSQLLNSQGINHEIRYNDRDDFRNSIDTLNFNSTNPKLMTYHSAKGLQFETVFLPYVESADSDDSRKSLYVAMTRTYRNLYVLYSSYVMPSPLSNVPSDLFISSETDTIEEL